MHLLNADLKKLEEKVLGPDRFLRCSLLRVTCYFLKQYATCNTKHSYTQISKSLITLFLSVPL